MATAIPSLAELEKLPVAPSPSPSAKVPTLEELLGDEEPVFQFSESPDGGIGEHVSGISRSALKGVSFGGSEAVVAGINATVATLLSQGKAEEAKSLLDKWQEFYAADILKQKQYEAEHPYLSGAAELSSGLIPGGPVAKLAGSMGKLAPKAETLGQAAKEVAKQGAVFGLLSAAGEQLAQAPIGKETAGEIAKKTALSIGVGAAAPVAMGGALIGGAKALAKTAEISSPLVKRVFAYTRGIPIEIQDAYVQLRDTVNKIGTREEVVQAMDEARQYILAEAGASKEALAKAEQNIIGLQKAIKRQVGEKKDEQSLKLKDALEGLKRIQDDLKLKIQGVPGTQSGAAEELKAAKTAIFEKTVGPAKEEAERAAGTAASSVAMERQMAAKAAKEAVLATKSKAEQQQIPASQFIPEVESALNEAKKTVSEASLEAIAALPDDVYIPSSVLLGAIRKQKERIKLGGLGTAEERSFIKYLDDMERSYSENLPLNLPPTKAKAVLQSLSRSLETTAPAKFAGVEQAALKDIYRTLNDQFKGFTEYQEKMAPVREMSKFLSDHENELDSQTKIRSFLEKAITDPREQGILEKLEMYTGHNVTNGPRQIGAARQLQSPQGLQAAIEALPEVREYNALKDQLARQKDPAVRAQLEARIPALKEAAEAKQRLLMAQDPQMLEELYSTLPQVKRLQELKGLVELSTNTNFEAEVFKNVADTEAGQAIVKLRRTISELTNPEFRKQQVMKIELEGGAKVLEAQRAAEEYEQKFLDASQKAAAVGTKATGESVLATLIANPKGYQKDPSVRLMQALSELPEEKLSEFFGSLGVTNKESMVKLVQALRIQGAFNQSFIRGSRGVMLFKAPIEFLTKQAAATETQTGRIFIRAAAGLLEGTASIIAAAYETGGGALVKSYLNAMANMQGVPSYQKLIKTLPGSEKARGAISQYASFLSSQIDSSSVMPVSVANRDQMEYDIKTSTIPPIKKAVALNQVQNGFIQGDLLKRLVLEGIPTQTTPLAARMVQFSKAE